MTIASLSEQLGLELPQEAFQLEEAFQLVMLPEHLQAVEAASAQLTKAIRDGTLNIEQIDAFLLQHPELTPLLKEHLLSKKAWLLSSHGELEEALLCYDEALQIDAALPSTWASKGAALLQLERIDEAFEAFETAYLYREKFGPQKQGYLEILFNVWSVTALFQTLLGIQDQHLKESEKGAHQYLKVLELARGENLTYAVLNLAVEKPITQDLQEALEELELMIRLLSIKDPFDRWRELTKEISKVWPEGVSAVDAIREQRDREWNT